MSAPRFAPEVEAAHRRVDVDDWHGIYVVGDVHGCRRELDALLDVLGVTAEDLVVFVGDLVRKGPDSHGVIERVRSAPNMLSVRGNNEEKVLRGDADPSDLTVADREWIAGLPLVISFADALVAHAGIDPRKPFRAQTVEDLQTVRSLTDDDYARPLWFDEWAGPRTVFFGHTPLSSPIDRPHAIGLDTGCVYGGALTAYDWHAGRFVQVDPERTVTHRPDSKFVTPRFDGAERSPTPASGTDHRCR